MVKMSSAICQNFVQNAWKKELCSNCFKSKDEHTERPKPKPVTIISNDNLESIIKNSGRFRPKRSVCFAKELTEIIGYGGEDWEDVDGPNEDTSSEDDFVPESEEEDAKELKRVTKENTDFNTVHLKEEPVVKKTTAQLKLGKPLVDASGRKQTLMVSVTPFGEDAPPSPKRFIKSISHIPISKTVNRENVPETKTNVVLTSYTKNEDEGKITEEKSLLDEITETLENGNNPIQIMSRKKIQAEIVLASPSIEAKAERKVGLSRTPALKRDQEKPVVCQSTARIELHKTTKLTKCEKIENKDPPKVFSQSREQAGEPDGRADPDTIEPPALPLSPPPLLETQTSFLHGNPPIYEKPKIPSKPATVMIRKPVVPNIDVKTQVLTTFTSDAKLEEKLSKQDVTNKRRAPKPPEDTAIYSRPGFLKGELVSEAPAPAPRKTLSVSTDSLASCDDKKKKGRFSLKKFLRMGSSKDGHKEAKPDDSVDGVPLPRPRLVIVHPSELNGAEVVTKPELEQEYQNIVQKPQPPPRNLDDCAYKPAHPPKSVDVLNKQKQYGSTTNEQKTETVYANIGEVRSAIVPNKPQRTASMREREGKNNYEPISIDGSDGSENVYDYISSGRSGSDSDSSPNKNSPTTKSARLKKRSESSIDVSGDYFKYTNMPRSLSLTYCGSETESEIYAPYSFCGSESEVAEDDHDWIQNGRTHKLRSRKGRSIVHKNLEDNYGAVIVANHEALAQVLENASYLFFKVKRRRRKTPSLG